MTARPETPITDQTADGQALAGVPCSPVRVTLSRQKGWRMPENTVKVCRPGKWGNPFHVADVIDHYDGDKIAAQADCVRSFRRWIEDDGVTAGIPERKQWMLDHLHELRGKNLACWCNVIDSAGNYAPCHADILLAVANGMTQDEVRNENLKAHEGRQKQPHRI